MENKLFLGEWYDIEYDDFVYCLSFVDIICIQLYSITISAS